MGIPKRKKPILPSKVCIRGRVWTVSEVAGLRDVDVPVMGICRADRRSIEIEADQSKDSKVEVLLHEIAHAYHFLTPIPGLADGYHEALCDHFASAVLDFLAGNDTRWIQ